MADKFEQWANVELMGHQRVVGRCSEELIAGHPMLRVDIPDGEGFTTRYYGSSAIYCLTVISEAVARKICSRISQAPSFAWDIKDHPKAIVHESAETYDDDTAGTAPSDAVSMAPTPRGSLSNSLGTICPKCGEELIDGHHKPDPIPPFF